MTRLVHTADTHVGYQQYHSPERRGDFLRAFESVIEDAIADDADAVVHAGDLFHDRRPGLVDIQGVIGALRRLREAGVPFLAVVGNHETKRDGQWLDLFEDLGLATRLDREPVVVGDVALYGQDFVPKARRGDLEYAFVPVAETDADAEFAALVSHGAFEPFAHADWDTETLLETAPVAFDALLLGDVHHPGRETVDGVLATYPGSTERASAEEREERGYNIVEFGDGEVSVSVTRRSVADAREFVFVDLRLEAGEGEGRVREAVRQHDLDGAVLIVTIEGEGEPVTPASVEELALERGALVARVNDRRELESEAEAAEVTFADPDQAVDRRLSGTGLSETAHEIDDLVRTADDVPDSRVRETVKRRVEERLDEDLAALERAPEATTDEAGAADETVPDERPADEAGTPEEAATDSDDASAEADDAPAPTGAESSERENDDAETGAEPSDAAREPADGENPDADSDAPEPAETDDESEAVGQASMEEYL